jgi:uncharacterized protein (TIGR02678 family)
MPSEQGPLEQLELTTCACHLIQHPLTCKEHDPELFRLILRHEGVLDRLFTQRLGYRLQVSADTARLYKTGFVAERRLLATASNRAFHPIEYLVLALVLGATVAGPGVISLRDLVERVRSAAVEAGITLEDSATTRRAFVTALQWMIAQGLAQELYARIEAYAGDATADAVIRLRPERIALLPLPALAAARDPTDLTDRTRARTATRQWMRCRLVEEPVLYRTDLTDVEWSELRRRIGEEERLLEEMFGLALEVRAEGVAAIDTQGNLSAKRFPQGGTVGQAALLLIERLKDAPGREMTSEELVAALKELTDIHRRRWAGEYVQAPERLARPVTDLLLDMRLAAWLPADMTAPDDPEDEQGTLRLLPAAGRFLPTVPTDAAVQGALW